MPFLSIIIPVHNAEKYLKGCIDSILAQTYKDFELLLINDGSTDQSEQICNDYLNEDNRIIVLHQENLGVSAARNAGLDMATGAYVGFVDADDTVDIDMYEMLISKANKQNADIAICGIRRLDATKSNVLGGTNQTRILNNKEGLNEFFDERIQGSVYDKIFRAEVIEKIRFEGKHYEDLLFTFLALSKARKTVFMDIQKYNYLVHESSLSRSKFSKNHIDTVLFSQKILNTTIKEFPHHLSQAKALDFVMNISLLNLILLNDKKNYQFEYYMVRETLNSYAKCIRSMKSLKIKHKVAYYIFKTSEYIYIKLLRLHGKIIGNAAAKLS